MTHQVLSIALLAMLTTSCWIGALGAWRMRKPTQALHYLSVLATIGAISLAIAVYVETGLSSATLKTILIAATLIASNSVGTHAAARAFRSRKFGRWEPRHGEAIEFAQRQRPS